MPANPSKVRSFNIYDGNLYQLIDPMLGASGSGGSYIGRPGCCGTMGNLILADAMAFGFDVP
jgi:hypothetical protein